ncbi:hypothetical protein [Clostridium psychrophilum]|uniref:hypothetical protein n=1 Tax=Clostridium psychrophilum TaxID=132926 RepID=UPI001C0AD3BF|nr:hypothetical protein [Clostridium psychrophilum]MBU3182365.1 hypothetical protein [Clostridium psychrophilum]
MYVEFNNQIIESNVVKGIIDKSTEFKVVKDMSKGTKRDDVLAFNLSIKINHLNDLLKNKCNLDDLTEDELFEKYLLLSEEIAREIKEYVPEGAVLDIKAYKWNKSDNCIKLIIIIATENTTELKLKDTMRKLITQIE